MDPAKPRSVVGRALDLISKHPSVHEIGQPFSDGTTNAVAVNVIFEVNLPSEWRQQGESPSGVRMYESVRFEFSRGFPMESPKLSLRDDFTRNLPHMMPWLIDGRPVPCIYEGDLRELLHKEGLLGILNQTALWLDRAALDSLIDPEQGWEPVRRDAFHDVVVANARQLQKLVDRQGGHQFMRLDYLKFPIADRAAFVHCRVSSENVQFNRRSIGKVLFESRLNGDTQVRLGRSLALAVWPGKHPSGEPIVCDTYLPETVDDIQSLKDRAALYGCQAELVDGLNWLRSCLVRHKPAGPYPLAVILLARRPFNVIESSSPIELCPYVVDVRSPDMFNEGDAAAVRAAAHRHDISRDLMTQMAGSAPIAKRPRWTLLGAGSLGSKLAIHLARAGNGPTVVLDRSALSPHNAARHALVGASRDMPMYWSGDKSWRLSEALGGLDQSAVPIRADAARVSMEPQLARRVWSRHTWAVVNATASLAVREALGANRAMPARVVETSLFAGGRIGLITVEGPGRSPSTTDLMAEFYGILAEDQCLGSTVFDRNNDAALQSIGQGCGSLTMAMSDGRLSLFAAGMSEYLLAKLRDGLPVECGEILLGQLSGNGLGVAWRTSEVPAATIAQARNGEAWRVHIHARAVSRIRDEIARWPDVETGGVLMGRLSEVSRVAHVVDVLDAPDDSSRSRDEFILGTKGLRQRTHKYSESVDWSLYCLGTWHSHLTSSGPSAKDRATGRAVALARLTPSIFVIATPTSFIGLTATTEDQSECLTI